MSNDVTSAWQRIYRLYFKTRFYTILKALRLNSNSLPAGTQTAAYPLRNRLSWNFPQEISKFTSSHRWSALQHRRTCGKGFNRLTYTSDSCECPANDLTTRVDTRSVSGRRCKWEDCFSFTCLWTLRMFSGATLWFFFCCILHNILSHFLTYIRASQRRWRIRYPRGSCSLATIPSAWRRLPLSHHFPSWLKHGGHFGSGTAKDPQGAQRLLSSQCRSCGAGSSYIWLLGLRWRTCYSGYLMMN